MSEDLPWVYWVWESGWRVLARYATREEGTAAARHAADPAGTWRICKYGSPEDRRRREKPQQR